MKTGPKPRTLAERFWPKVEKTDGCWIWRGALHSFGSGQIGAGGWHGKPLFAHRVAWELTNGPVPDGLWVLHRCDTPPCVRPEHLFLGNHQENMADMARKGRGHRSGLRGTQVGTAKLTEPEVREIRRRRQGGEPSARIASHYGVTPRVVWLIGAGRAWTHVV
jgi:hypothetical protein